MGQPSRGNQVVAAAISGIVISTVAVVLRIWSRLAVRTNRIWWDDCTAVLAWVFAVANCATAIFLVRSGFGQHENDVLNHPGSFRKILLTLFIDEFLYNTGITMVKLSVLCFYARIFEIVKGFRYALWSTALLAVAWFVTWTVVSAVGCIPVKLFWDPDTPGHCVDPVAIAIATATTNVIIDFIILILPLPLTFSLRMGWLRRLGFAVVFVLGYSVMIISILRTISAVRAAEAESSQDFTWSEVEIEILYVLEVPIGVVSICLPSILSLGRTGYLEGWSIFMITDRFKRLSDSGRAKHMLAGGDRHTVSTNVTGGAKNRHDKREESYEELTDERSSDS